MDNKARIEREAEEFAAYFINDELVQKAIKKGYITGATAEQERCEKWNLSREKMPDFDGEYLVAGWLHYECGNVTQFQKVVTCRLNQWVKSDVGEQMTYWRELLPMPKETLTSK